ncbi:hypothetical protein HQ520_06210, partial [bacterium]|nr:hypothetical protein [bacterium]
VEKTDETGKPLIIRQTRVNTPQGWKELPGDSRLEKLFLLYAPKPEVFFRYYPNWARDEWIEVTVRDIAYKVRPSNLFDPFAAGEATLLVPRTCRQVSDNEVEIDYDGGDMKAAARWTLPPTTGARDLRAFLALDVPRDGFYSVGFSAQDEWGKAAIQNVQLPPLYQFQRVPDRTVLVMSSITPHPFSLVQIPLDEGSVSVAACAEPEKIDFRWFDGRNALYGFSLTNEKNRVQPTVFSPILGLRDSEWKAGEKRSVAWRLLIHPGDWEQALEYFSDRVMGVKDYRSPIVSDSPASLTDVALNTIDLIRNPEVSGWNEELKGFWNIEMRRTVTQAAPLALLSAAMLGRDEYFFQQRALPSIEFILTRPMPHSGLPVAVHSHEQGQEVLPLYPTESLTIGQSTFGLSIWEGVQNMMGGLNPWLVDLLAPGGRYIKEDLHKSSPLFSERLAAYRLDPTPEKLAAAKKAADEFIESQFESRQETVVSFTSFYNIHFYPFWWDLVDLYELTGEQKYRDAAREGAFLSVAGLWSTPPIPDRNITVHPGGKFLGATTILMKGNERFRLGYPRNPGDGIEEEVVPAWQVAQVGLGIEQPSTYVHHMNSYMWNIQMPPWAPNLLRAYDVTDRDIFRTYARNAIIGRFANFAGYGHSGYTTKVFDSRYPYAGPDLTRSYFHHIPVHLGITLDYLFTQAMSRSGGQIKFPHSWQNGYAYFVNRAFGLQPGEIYGETGAVPWLRRGLVKIGGDPESAISADWLAARSDDRFFVILMSQKKEDADFPVSINARAARLAEGPGRMYVGEEEVTVPPVFAGEGDWKSASVRVPALGEVVLSLPAERQEAMAPVPPLRNGHTVRDVEGWGELHTFRFRTPFGKDALYVVFLDGPTEGPTVQADLKGSYLAPLTRKRFPWEFTFYPCPMGEDLEVELSIITAEGEPPPRITVKAPGE